jgi:hypothetical protein
MVTKEAISNSYLVPGLISEIFNFQKVDCTHSNISRTCFIHSISEWNSQLHINVHCEIQAFLDFRGFDFHDFRFNAVYNSILFSSPLVLLLVTSIYAGFAFAVLFFCPQINSVNQGMPVIRY